MTRDGANLSSRKEEHRHDDGYGRMNKEERERKAAEQWTAGKLTFRLTRDASATATLTIVVVVTVAIAGGPREAAPGFI